MSDSALNFLINFPQKILIPVVNVLGDFFLSPINSDFIDILYSLFPAGQAPAFVEVLANATVIDVIIGLGLPTILALSIVKWVIGIIM